MKTVSFSFVLTLCLVWLGSACNKEDKDELAPTVNYVLIDGTATESSVVAGTSFTISAGFTDETGLNQVRVEIADLFGGTSAYNAVKIYDLESTNDEASWSIDLSDTIASGPYILEVMAVDLQGNQSDTFEVNFDITQATQPVINLTAPDFSQTLNYNAGDTVVFAGTVTDESDLEGIKMELLFEGVSQTNVTYLYTDSIVTVWDFSQLTTDWWFFIIPTTLTANTYDLEVTAADSDGNYTRTSTTVEVN